MIRGFSKVAFLVFALSSGAASAASPTFIFTAIPDQDETRLVERFSRFAQYLEGRLGTRVKYVPVKTYPAAVTAFTNNDVQLAWFGGFTGFQARRAVPGAEAIAQGAEDVNFKSYFIANVETGLKPFLGRAGHYFGRVFLVIARSTPECMLAYPLLQLMGPSMLPAFIALSLHNGAIVGYLLERQTDELAFRADAPKGVNLFDTTPRVNGQFLAYMLYRWEIILRESAIFGILGVRTLGYYLDAAISELRLDTALILLLSVAAVSISADVLSRGLRHRPRIDTLPTRLSANRGLSTALAQ